MNWAIDLEAALDRVTVVDWTSGADGLTQRRCHYAAAHEGERLP